MRPSFWTSCGFLYGRSRSLSRPSTSGSGPSRRHTPTPFTSTPTHPGSCAACGSRSRTSTRLRDHSFTSPAAIGCRRSRRQRSRWPRPRRSTAKYESYVDEQISRQRLRAAPRSPQEGSGVALVVQPSPWRLAEAGPRAHPPQPGDALLLRGLPLLDAKVVSDRQDAPAQPEFHHLRLSRLSFDDPAGLSRFAGSAAVNARSRAGDPGRGRRGSDPGPGRPGYGRRRRRP